MIAIGMIVGSDYTKGIPNVGIMTALEILQEFHGTCMERLEKFRLILFIFVEFKLTFSFLLDIGGKKHKIRNIKLNQKCSNV